MYKKEKGKQEDFKVELVVSFDDSTQQSFELKLGINILGSSSKDANIFIDKPELDKKHLTIELESDQKNEGINCQIMPFKSEGGTHKKIKDGNFSAYLPGKWVTCGDLSKEFVFYLARKYMCQLKRVPSNRDNINRSFDVGKDSAKINFLQSLQNSQQSEKKSKDKSDNIKINISSPSKDSITKPEDKQDIQGEQIFDSASKEGQARPSTFGKGFKPKGSPQNQEKTLNAKYKPPSPLPQEGKEEGKKRDSNNKVIEKEGKLEKKEEENKNKKEGKKKRKGKGGESLSTDEESNASANLIEARQEKEIPKEKIISVSKQSKALWDDIEQEASKNSNDIEVKEVVDQAALKKEKLKEKGKKEKNELNVKRKKDSEDNSMEIEDEIKKKVKGANANEETKNAQDKSKEDKEGKKKGIIEKTIKQSVEKPVKQAKESDDVNNIKPKSKQSNVQAASTSTNALNKPFKLKQEDTKTPVKKVEETKPTKSATESNSKKMKTKKEEKEIILKKETEKRNSIAKKQAEESDEDYKIEENTQEDDDNDLIEKVDKRKSAVGARKKVNIMFSNCELEGTEIVKKLENIGGRVVWSAEIKFDVLVMDDLTRRAKTLVAINRGVPIVSPSWCLESVYQEKLIEDYSLYPVKVSKDFEKAHSFSLPEVMQRRKNTKGEVLNSFKFLLPIEFQYSNRQDMESIIISAGGQIVLEEDNEDMKQVIVVLDKERNDPQLQNSAKKRNKQLKEDLIQEWKKEGYTCIEADAIFESCLLQKPLKINSSSS